MKLHLALMLAVISLFSQSSFGEACKGTHGCTLEEVDLTRNTLESHRSTHVIKFSGTDTPWDKVPIPALYPPAFTQKYVSISVDSDTDYVLTEKEISEINDCIARKERCFLPSTGRTLRNGDVLTLVFFRQNKTMPETEKMFDFAFQPGLASKVVLKGFQGGFLSEGTRIKYSADKIVFESSDNGFLIFSQVPSWKSYALHTRASAWAGRVDVKTVEEIAKQIFPPGVKPAAAARIAQEWISGNIKYANRRQTVLEMQQPADLRQTLSSKEADCKGMVLLLQSLLAAAGINSQPAYTRLGDPEKLYLFDPDIPMPNYFNHIVLYVPSIDRYYDATLRTDQLDTEITDYMSFALNAETGALACFGKHDCKGVPLYRLPH